MIRVVAVFSILAAAYSHGAMTFPRPRNALDGQLAPWTTWSYPCDATHQGDNCKITFCEDGKNCGGSCPISSHSGVKDALNASNGQSCYWFSNGCTIGCDKCDGTTNHVGHGMQQFLYKGMTLKQLRSKNITLTDPWNPKPGDMVLNPASTKNLEIKSMCANPTTNATVCDPRLRTANTQAKCGSPEDFYFFSPWRAPGSAPVIDSCGSAGGRYPGQGTGGAGAQFENSSVAKEGDVGSHLAPMSPQATWEAGSVVEVGWTVMANHGGGYAYRLAPEGAPLTEETFRKMPLDFVGPSVLRWDGDRSTQEEFDTKAKGWETNQGTLPKGSTWRKNPIPTVLWEREGPAFQPVCKESDACLASIMAGGDGHAPFTGACRCSGHSNGGPLLPSLEVVDSIQIPASLQAGNYVLQWRWDCEESDQIWASCSDVKVTVTAPASDPPPASLRRFAPAPTLV